MEMILAGLALIIGLTAIWLATTSMKKIDSAGDLLLQRIRNEQRKSMDEPKAKVETVEKKNQRMSDRLNSLSPGQDDP